MEVASLLPALNQTQTTHPLKGRTMFIVFALILIMGACFAVRRIDEENNQLRAYARNLEVEVDELRTVVTTRKTNHDFLTEAPFNVRDIRRVS